MNLRKNLVTGGVAASLMASLFAVSMAGPAIAATASPVTTTVIPNGSATNLPIATVTATAATDIPVGTLTLSLPAGYSWAATGTIATVETGAPLAVSDGAIILGGTTATFTVSVAAVAGSTIAFSSPTVKTTTGGASGAVVLSGLSNPSSVVVARVHFTGLANGRNQDNDRGKGHGARKGAFFLNPSWSCPTGAQPIADAATYGFAVLNTTGHHMLNVNVVLKGALPNATYDVWVNQDPGLLSAGACPLAAATKTGAVHTNAKGNGTAHLRVAIVSGATHFWVSATNGTSGTIVLRTRAVSLTIKH
jgi:hypothetical protein